MHSKRPLRAFAALLLVAVSVLPRAGMADGAWVERVQVVHDREAGTVHRVRLRAWDPDPRLNLEFVWEPEPGATPPGEGAISGTGKLVWRVRGSAAYDPRTIHSTYRGAMLDGRPHGHGRLETRDGAVREGTWVEGVLDGEGMMLDTSGNRYEGMFVAGLPHGEGRQAMADGSVYAGGFRNGLRHGTGTLRLAGGTVYESRWRDGVETGDRPDIVADALLGGLLPAQSDGGDAARVGLSVMVEPRMTQRSDLKYTHYVGDERIDIYPDDARILAAWKGENRIEDWSFNYMERFDWEDAPAFVEVDLETQDRSRVRTRALELQVSDSQVYRRPQLSTMDHLGCVSFRPSFSFQNNGWGPAREGRLSFRFFNQEDPAIASRSFELPVGDIDQGLDFSVRSVLDEAGVDTAALEQTRFNCGSREELPQCQAELKRRVELGELADIVSGRDYWATVGLRGTFTYSWSDDRGNRYEESQELKTRVQLALIETEIMVAEGGQGWGPAPEALRFQVVELPRDRRDYVIDMPIRGNRNLSNYTARLKFYAETSSIHQFRVAAKFDDGSERYSKPVALFMVRPRDYAHQRPEPAGGCYLDPMFAPWPE